MAPGLLDFRGHMSADRHDEFLFLIRCIFNKHIAPLSYQIIFGILPLSLSILGRVKNPQSRTLKIGERNTLYRIEFS